MIKKKKNPPTSSQRWKVSFRDDIISKVKPEKSLLYGIKSTGGRSKTGRLTIRNRGGGHKKKLRIIDFQRIKDGVDGIVDSIQYDPNRSARIALIKYVDGFKSYILAPDGLISGMKVSSGKSAAPELGNSLPLKDIPVGLSIHNLEISPGKGGSLVRSAGTCAQLLSKNDKYATIKLPSGERRMILLTCRATVGRVSNILHSDERLGKAGRNRWLGRRPRVRGVAMNPVDHPMGGGEGKASGGHPRSRNGIFSKGQKTRKSNKYSDKLIIHREKK